MHHTSGLILLAALFLAGLAWGAPGPRAPLAGALEDITGPVAEAKMTGEQHASEGGGACGSGIWPELEQAEPVGAPGSPAPAPGERPPLDQQSPAEFATATFALG